MTVYEKEVRTDLHQYLLSVGEVDERLPETPDIEDLWEHLAQAYLPDGIREFAGYPQVSLGWMMYVGMAVAKMWDEDWERYSKADNLYLYLRDKRGYDCMDEYIREEVLGLNGDDFANAEKLVGECAARTNNRLSRSGFEPGTRNAFLAYVNTIHQLYLMGSAVQLKRMGYRMVTSPSPSQGGEFFESRE